MFDESFIQGPGNDEESRDGADMSEDEPEDEAKDDEEKEDEEN